MATLHFICGKAGAGKTTLARELGRALPAVVFCEDEWICTLGFEIRSLEDFAAASARCRGLIAPLAVDLLRLGVSVVFDFFGNTVSVLLNASPTDNGNFEPVPGWPPQVGLFPVGVTTGYFDDDTDVDLPAASPIRTDCDAHRQLLLWRWRALLVQPV